MTQLKLLALDIDSVDDRPSAWGPCIQEIVVRKRGRTVATIGAYSVVELLEVYLDGTEGVIGYHLLGPGADIEWLHGSIQEAETAARKLNDPYPAPGG